MAQYTFIFQHAEEQTPGGALEIIKSGVLKGVNAIFGMHVLPNFPAGHIGVFPKGPASTAGTDSILRLRKRLTWFDAPFRYRSDSDRC